MDPDQIALSESSDLGLQCYLGLSEQLTRVKDLFFLFF